MGYVLFVKSSTPLAFFDNVLETVAHLFEEVLN